MADQTRIELEGDDTLARTLRDAQADIRDLDQSESARLVEQRARANAPKLSGQLAGSVRASDLARGVVQVSSDLVYAPVIHYGWSGHNISPQPFLVDALNNSVPLIVEATERQVEKQLDQVRGA